MAALERGKQRNPKTARLHLQELEFLRVGEEEARIVRDGKLGIQTEIWERAVQFSSIDSIGAFEFVKVIALAMPKSDYIDLPENPLKQILERALHSGDAETVSDATALIHHLGEHGFDTFGELLGLDGRGRPGAGV